MGRTKQGAKSIPREAWELEARAYLQVARELGCLVDRSLATLSHLLEGNVSPPEWRSSEEEARDSVELVRVAMARGRAEVEVFELDPPDDLRSIGGKMEAELRCVLKTLVNLSGKHIHDARNAFRIANSERRGRKAKPRNALEAAVLGVHWAKPSKRRPGRSVVVPISSDELLSIVESGRRDFGDASARASLRRFAASLVSGDQSSWRTREAHEKLVSNLEKRLSRVRSKLPK